MMKKVITALLAILLSSMLFSAAVSAASTMSAPASKVLLIYANGNQYEGDFINGMFHGKGVFTWANGDRYEGDFFLISAQVKAAIGGRAVKVMKAILLMAN